MKKIIFLMILSVIFMSCSDNGTEPESKLKIMISPTEEHVIIDSIAMFELKIENVTNFFAFSGEIHFNSSIVELQTDQIIIGNIWNTEPLLQTIFETDCLNICIGLTQTNGSDSISGDGTLFSFSLKGINIGQGDITLNNIQLIDENGSLIDNFNEIEISNSIIYVESE